MNGPLSRRLIEGDEAQHQYRNSVLFHRIVQAVDAAEHQGIDPVPVLRDGMVAMAAQIERLHARCVQLERERTVPLMQAAAKAAYVDPEPSPAPAPQAREDPRRPPCERGHAPRTHAG